MKILLLALILTAGFTSAQQPAEPRYAMDNYFVGFLKKGVRSGPRK